MPLQSAYRRFTEKHDLIRPVRDSRAVVDAPFAQKTAAPVPSSKRQK
jgi:hypothetical protein